MATDPEERSSERPRVYVYRGTLSPLTGLLLLAPLLLFFFSLVAALLVGGAAAALVVPFLLRWRLGGGRQPTDSIELGPDQYRRVDGDASSATASLDVTKEVHRGGAEHGKHRV